MQHDLTCPTHCVARDGAQLKGPRAAIAASHSASGKRAAAATATRSGRQQQQLAVSPAGCTLCTLHLSRSLHIDRPELGLRPKVGAVARFCIAHPIEPIHKATVALQRAWHHHGRCRRRARHCRPECCARRSGRGLARQLAWGLRAWWVLGRSRRAKQPAGAPQVCRRGGARLPLVRSKAQPGPSFAANC